MIVLFGNIEPPPGVNEYIWNAAGNIGPAPGMLIFFNNLVKLIIVAGGLFAFINIILAGLGFISAGGEPKKIESAWAKIWQSLIGLLIIAASFVLAAIFGWILFKDPTAILRPKIYHP